MVIVIGLQDNDGRIRVACLGDSLTGDTSYPRDLQTLLGDDYVVGNFGVTSSTVQLDTYIPYFYQIAFFKAKSFRPDIAVIMLGTNDARYDYVQSLDSFVEDYARLIGEIQGFESKPIVFVVKPPPLFQNELELNDEAFVEEVLPLIEETAEGLGLIVVDVYSTLAGNPEYFPDGVHPTSEGASVIAGEVYEAIIRYESAQPL